MNLTSPIVKGAAHAAELPGDTVASFLRQVGDSTSLLADDSPDGWLGILMSGLSGVATALAVAGTKRRLVQPRFFGGANDRCRTITNECQSFYSLAP